MPTQHHIYMKMAQRMAKRGGRLVRPNPLVGCVLVKNDHVISSGYHPFFGGPHAEVMALKKAGSNARGATAYLTLEPCSHWGKTAPCAPQLVKAGIKQVYVSVQDPNPRVNGKGISYLKKHGCKVVVGVEGKSSERLIKPFKSWVLKKRPYIILKMAQSLDGKIATRTGHSRWVTGPESRSQVHDLRAQSDAVIIGAQTALVDNPALTSHGAGENPLRVLLDPNLKTPIQHQIFNVKEAKTLVYTSLKPSHSRVKLLLKKGVDVLHQKSNRKLLDLRLLLKHLYELGVYQVMVEGGGATAWNFLEKKLVDEIYFYVAPKIVGGKSAIGSVSGEGVSKMLSAFAVDDFSVTKSGPDFLFHGYMKA